MDSLNWITKIKKAISPLPTITFAGFLLMILPVLIIFPQHALSINQQAQPVENLEQNVNVEEQPGQQAQDLKAEQGDMQAQDYGVVDNLTGDMDPSDYDLIIEIPIQVERLYPQVGRIYVICSVGRTVELGEGSSFTEDTQQTSIIKVYTENGAYEGLFRFFFAIPFDQTPDDLTTYSCASYLGVLGSGQMRRPYQGNISGDVPAWALITPESTGQSFSGSIEW